MSSFIAFLYAIILFGGLFYFAACVLSFWGLFQKRKKEIINYPFVSIIIPARNEGNNIGRLLDLLSNQRYPKDKYEIIVVDDCSEDNTEKIVLDKMNLIPGLKLTGTRFSKSPYTYKKKAVHEGILSGKGDVYVIVDADCLMDENWLKSIVGYIDEETDLVAGSVCIKEKGIIGGFEALEFSGIQTMAAGLMNSGFPVTCNGGNLAYKKSAFDTVSGFEGVGHVISGDDDLLMQKINENKTDSVVWALDKDVFVYVDSHDNLRSFIEQRSRWASKILSYESKKAILFLFIFFAYFVSLFLGIILFSLNKVPFIIIAGGFGLKAAGDFLLCFYGLLKFNKLQLIWFLPVAEILHIPYILFVTIKGIFGTFKWQGRKAASTISKI